MKDLGTTEDLSNVAKFWGLLFFGGLGKAPKGECGENMLLALKEQRLFKSVCRKL